MLDLHLHSTYSDGTVSPEGLVAMARARGLSAVALTDHDTAAGIPEFLAAAGKAPRPRCIPGIELACRWYTANLHIVGLFIDPTEESLKKLLENIQAARRERNRLIMERLAALGAPVAAETLDAVARGEVTGRPHFAQALIAAGHCRTLQEAFSRFLARGGPAYVRRALPLPKAAIEAIHAAGGVAVWAHPAATRGPSAARMRQVCRRLAAYDLDGIEVCYAQYSPRDTATVRALAREFHLLPSGGSDFHGDNSPGVAMGTGRGDLRVPDEWLGPLEERAAAYRAR